MARTTWAERIEGKVSKACCAPGSSAYTTEFGDTARSLSTKARAWPTSTRVSLVPWMTKKSGSSPSTRRMGEAASKRSGSRSHVVWSTRGPRKPSRIPTALRRPVEPAKS